MILKMNKKTEMMTSKVTLFFQVTFLNISLVSDQEINAILDGVGGISPLGNITDMRCKTPDTVIEYYFGHDD